MRAPDRRHKGSKKHPSVSCSLCVVLFLLFGACSEDTPPKTQTTQTTTTSRGDTGQTSVVPLDMALAKDLAIGQDLGQARDASSQGDQAAPDLSSANKTPAQIFAQFGTIETIAGLGKEGDKAVNGWRQEYESGPAVDAELSRPHIALADAKGNVYIADKDAHAIRKVTPSGEISTVAGTSVAGNGGDGIATQQALSSPNGLWVKEDGTLFVYDLGNRKIRKVTPSGQMTTLFDLPSAGSGRGLWVNDEETEAFVSAGTILYRWSSSGGVTELAQGFSSLANLHVGPKGQLGVADRDGHQAWLIDRQTGAKTALAGNGSTSGASEGEQATLVGLDELRGLWFHPDGGVLIATHKGGKVWYVSEAGELFLFLDGDKDRDTHGGDGGSFDQPGKKISEPRAVTMTPQGEVLVTENDRGFIRVVRRR